MKTIRVATAALNLIPGAFRTNRVNILEAIRQARERNVQVLLCPEMCISGYNNEDRFFSPGLQRRSLKSLKLISEQTGGMVAFVGLPIVVNKAIFNSIAIMMDGKVEGFWAKQNLANDGIHYEARQMKEWPRGVVTNYEFDGCEVPIGDFMIEVEGIRIGLEECEDMFVPDRPGIRLAQRGVDIIVNPSASHFSPTKEATREMIVLEGSRAFGCVYLYANLLGNEAGRAIYDGHRFIAQDGSLVARGRRLTFNLVEITDAVVDLVASRVNRSRMASFRPVIDNDGSVKIIRIATVSNIFANCGVTINQPVQREDWEGGSCFQNDEWTRAACLGLFDYLWKSKATGWVVSLSGGCDSSVVSTLCALSVHMAIQELGLSEFKKRLSYIAAIQHLDDPKKIVGAMLTCVYQSTKNSSKDTLKSAETLAADLGATFSVVDVQPFYDAFLEEIERILGRTLDQKRDGISRQNLQARVRVPVVWGVANATGRLLLTTSNRTEAAVGYCTMDGDTAGGLNPIGGTDKPFLRQWVHWALTTGPHGLFRVGGLSIVDTLTPSAELEPGQTDEKDLGPYPVVNRLGSLAVVDGLEPLEALEVLSAEFGQYQVDDLYRWVRKFFFLLAINQWKRERLAVSFHLSDHNLDPRSWFRYPILNAAYVEELEEMQEWYETRH